MPRLNCIVAGGGLGGLTAAIALAESGHQVTLLEQAPKIEPIGYGIQFGPNVMPVFKRLGLLDEVYSKSHFPSAVLMLDYASGDIAADIPLGDAFMERFKHHYICIHRGDIHTILLDAAGRNANIELKTGIRVSGYRNEGGRVIVESSADEYEADLLVGADGFNSALRGALHPESEAQPIGYVAHRSIVPFDQVPDIIRKDPVTMWAGDGYHVIYYPLPDYGMNFVGVFSMQGEEVTHGVARREQLLKRCHDGHPEMLAILKLMDFESRWELADRKPLRKWSDGRAVLLGDAIHSTFQSLAQGACMAIEDALELSDCLNADGQSVGDALKQYERNRFNRTARVQLESRELWTTYHVGGMHAEVRNAKFQTFSPDDFYDCLSWVWTSPIAS